MNREHVRFLSVNRCLPLVILSLIVSGLLVSVGCGNSSKTASSGEGAGNLKFSLKVDESLKKQGVNPSMAASIDCAALGVSTVTAEIWDSADINKIAFNENPWNCTDGQGDLMAVPVGSNYTLKVFLKDSSGNIIMTGRKPGITVEPNTITDAGTITVSPVSFSVTYTSPLNGATNTSIASAIAVTFNAAVDTSTFTSTSFIVSTATGPAYGSIAFSSNNTVATWTADGGRLSRGMTYTVRLTTAIKSAIGGIPLAQDYTFSFTTGLTNTAPVINSITNMNPATRVCRVNSGSAVNLQVNATDADGDTLTYEIANPPDNGDGSYYPFTFNSSTGAYTWTSAVTGEYLVMFKVTDNGSPKMSAWRRVKIVVNGMAAAQEDHQPIMHIVSDDTELKVRKTATTDAAVNISFDPLYSSAMVPSLILNSFDPRDTFLIPMYSVTGSYTSLFSWATPTQGNYYMDVWVDYGWPQPQPTNYKHDLITILLTVGNAPTAPLLDPIGDRTVNTGQLLSFTVTATGSNVSNTTFSTASVPYYPNPMDYGATFNASTQAFSWTPPVGGPSEYSMTFTARDNTYQDILYDSETITITITSN